MNQQRKIPIRCTVFMLKIRSAIQSKGLQLLQFFDIPPAYKNIPELTLANLVKKVDSEMSAAQVKQLFNDLCSAKRYVQVQNFINTYDKVCKKIPNLNPESPNDFPKSNAQILNQEKERSNSISNYQRTVQIRSKKEVVIRRYNASSSHKIQQKINVNIANNEQSKGTIKTLEKKGVKIRTQVNVNVNIFKGKILQDENNGTKKKIDLIKKIEDIKFHQDKKNVAQQYLNDRNFFTRIQEKNPVNQEKIKQKTLENKVKVTKQKKEKIDTQKNISSANDQKKVQQKDQKAKKLSKNQDKYQDQDQYIAEQFQNIQQSTIKKGDQQKINFEKGIQCQEQINQQIQQVSQIKVKKPSNQQKKQQQQQQKDKSTEKRIQIYDQFPNASHFFRRNAKNIQNRQIEILQHLQILLQKDVAFHDKSNPVTHKGHYTSSQDIFKQQYHLFEAAPSLIYRDKNRTGIAQQIEPKDIIQGGLGNCYYLSSIASIGQHFPEIISQRFVLQKNSAGLYAVELFIDGEWKIYETDAYFPCQHNRPCFSKPHGKQIWVMLLEKCWAKVFGKYTSIISGSSTEAFKALTGGPCEHIQLQQTVESKNNIKIALQQAAEKKYLVTTSGNKTLDSMLEVHQQKIGLVGNHAYSVFSLVKINNQTLVKMRNPWGSRVWLGRWSFNSKQWTQSLKEQHNYKKSDEDGIFYMPWQQYIKYFGSLSICKAKPENRHTSLRMNNNSRKSNYIQLTVKKSGIYHVSIYQQNKRKFGKDSAYEFSPARIIILRKQGNQLIYVGSANKATQDSTVQCKLQPGKYIISAKVAWINHKQHESVLCCYGPQKVLIKQINRDIAVQFKQKMLQTYAVKMSKENKSKKSDFSWLGVPEASEQYLFDIPNGIGFIKISNQSQKTFKCTYTMTKMKGIKIIKPRKSPFQFLMKPGTTEIIGFFVSHKQYAPGWSKTGMKM